MSAAADVEPARAMWEQAFLGRVLETIPAEGDAVDYLHTFATALLETREAGDDDPFPKNLADAADWLTNSADNSEKNFPGVYSAEFIAGFRCAGGWVRLWADRP